MDTYNSKFGQLKIGQGPEDNFLWTGSIDISNTIYSGQIPIYIFTKECKIQNRVIDLAEKIVLNIDQYLEKSVLFIKQTLTEEREKYNIREDEYDLLNLDTDHFPIDVPELTFWENSIEWMMRFAEGRFSICDPLGIAVTYSLTTPKSVDNLEESEYLD